MATTPEGRVKAKVKEWLRSRGVWFCMPMGTGFGVNGVPDFICCWDGMFFSIETKAPGKIKNVTVGQQRQMELIRKAGGIALVIDDVTQLDGVQLYEQLRGS